MFITHVYTYTYLNISIILIIQVYIFCMEFKMASWKLTGDKYYIDYVDSILL